MWQPIETAPRDGSNIILLIHGEAIQGYFDKKDLNYYSPKDEWEVVVLPTHGCGCCGCENDLPTHWMPLPEVPKED
jgi:hypothetical protein